MLKLLGIRFIITDLPIPGAHQREKITIPAPAGARARASLSDLNVDSFELYLYELADVNLGQFNPTQVKIANNAADALALLSDTTIDLGRTAIATEVVGQGFTKAVLKRFAVEKGHYRVAAKSEGKAILVLPVEYSRCLSVSNLSSGPAPKLFRANLLLTGIVFEDTLDANIAFFTGPFRNSRCRLDDLKDSHHMEMKYAFRDQPGTRSPWLAVSRAAVASSNVVFER